MTQGTERRPILGCSRLQSYCLKEPGRSATSQRRISCWWGQIRNQVVASIQSWFVPLESEQLSECAWFDPSDNVESLDMHPDFQPFSGAKRMCVKKRRRHLCDEVFPATNAVCLMDGLPDVCRRTRRVEIWLRWAKEIRLVERPGWLGDSILARWGNRGAGV
jgi:hypothetical protein